MTFLEGVPDSPPEPSSSPEPRPLWQGPLEGWIGGAVPWHQEMFSGTNLHVALTNVFAFPSGVLFDVDIRVRPGCLGKRGPGSTHELLRFSLKPGYPRLGFAYSDGREAIVGRPVLHGQRSASLIHYGGSGSEQNWLHHMWLWPLPAAGPLEMAYAWDAAGIGAREFWFEGSELASAAEKAKHLWDVRSDDPSQDDLGSSELTVLGDL